MRHLFLILTCFAIFAMVQSRKSRDRDGKVLSLFNIVRFNNGPCEGDSKNGTCYTAEECETKGGTNSGSCAAGYGVCCTFTVRCGAQISENCTYFESSGSEIGQCGIKICKCDSNICQLRLDFSQFAITGPSTSTASVLKTLAGQAAGGMKNVATATQCLTDTFSVTSPAGISPPSICGTNSGEHMYVDASDMCNDLIFMIGRNGVGATLVQRTWSIKVTQYSCDYDNLAPQGCTQYFFGAQKTTDIVKTFNYDGGVHLADQNQQICVRRERGVCKICWSPVAKGDFSVSGETKGPGMSSMSMGFSMASCCGYGADGMGTKGYDCVIIDGAVKNTNDMKGLGERFCGRQLVSNDMDMASKTICSARVPFSLRFVSDHFEFTDMMKEAGNPGVGARLAYELVNCGGLSG